MNTSSTLRDTNRPATLAAAAPASPQAIIQARMNFNSVRQRDPVTRAERDMSVLSPDIDNNGGSLYNPETFCIVHRFENESDKQRRENEDSGYGAYNDAELHTYVAASFYDSYEEEAWSFTQPTYDYYNTYSDSYIQMVLDGDMVDDGFSCSMPSATLGGSVLLGGWTFDFDASYDTLYGDYGLTTEFDYLAPLELTEGLDGATDIEAEAEPVSGMDMAADATPEAPAEGQVNQIANASAANEDAFDAEEDGMEATAPPAAQQPQTSQTQSATQESMSAAASPIQSRISLSNQFASATTPAREPSEDPSLDADVAPRAMTMAANQSAYQRSA